LMSPSIRPLLPADLAAVTEVERESFSMPWSAGMIALELQREGAVTLAAESEGRLIGFAICACEGDDWSLLRIAVRPGDRRAGIARGLMAALLEKLPDDARITLEVRESNAAAIAFYERLGFLIGGRRRRYYADTGEDGLIMWRTECTLRGSLEDVPNPESYRR